MDEGGAGEAVSAHERSAEPEPLDDRGRHREPDEREPDEARKHVDRGEERERHEDEHRSDVRDKRMPRTQGRAGHERCRGDVAHGDEERCDRDDEEPPVAGRSAPDEPVDGDDRHPEREPFPEAGAVEAYRLAYQLAHGPLLGWERWRQSRVLRPRAPRHEAEGYSARTVRKTRIRSPRSPSRQ